MKIKLNIFKDKKSLIFINSNKEFFSMKTDEDFISLEDFEIINEGEVITYQSETIMESVSWKKDRIVSFRENSKKFDLLVEVSFKKLNYKDIKSTQSYKSSKKITKLRIMTFELCELKSKVKKADGLDTSTYDKIQTMIIKPNQILERELENGDYNLKSLIIEFKRNSKLNDLGLTE
ncbi:MAG: hypothetical protein EB079_01005 [Verrucomicrobia bacterium]|nr:hypothetical protein [Verrucomicrobiota bacterium]